MGMLLEILDTSEVISEVAKIRMKAKPMPVELKTNYIITNCLFEGCRGFRWLKQNK